MIKTIEQQSDLLKLISDPTRLKIIKTLLLKNREVCVNDIAEDIGSSHSATSHQLAKLEAHGIVNCIRKGQMMCYKTTNSHIVSIIKKILKLI